MPDETVIEGVILAAGSSFRAGTFKPAMQIGDTSMIEHCIRGMHGICRRIIVVGGHQFGRLRLLVEGFAGVECIENRSYQKGMFTSVKAGLSHVQGDRCFVLPVDIPLVPPRVYQQLLAVDAEVVIPSFQGRRGHPVCCSEVVLPRILSEPDDSSFRAVLRKIGFRTLPVDAEEILVDIDTPEDYEKVRRRFV